MRFGRFAAYFENIAYEKLENEKVRITELILEDFLPGSSKMLYEFDGMIRVIGPIRGRSGWGIVLSVPHPPAFEVVYEAFKNAKGAPLKPRWVVGFETFDKDKLAEILRIKAKKILNFSGLKGELEKVAEKAESFLGIKSGKLKYTIENMKIKRNGNIYSLGGIIVSKNPYTSFIIKYARYTGFGENLLYGYGDLEVNEYE